jgi:hypothetical protein
MAHFVAGPTGARAALVGMHGSMKPDAGRTLVLDRHRMPGNIGKRIYESAEAII